MKTIKILMMTICLFTLNSMFAQTKQAKCCKDCSSCCSTQKCCKMDCKKDCCNQSDKKQGMSCCNKPTTGNEVGVATSGIAMGDKNCCCNKKGDTTSNECCKNASCCK